MKNIIAFDPGGTTGVAGLSYDDENVNLVSTAQVPDGLPGAYEFLKSTPDGENLPEELTIVSESFTLRPEIKGADITPKAIEGLFYGKWQDRVVYQPPSIKPILSDEIQKELGFWVPDNRHANDAIKHALIYLLRTGEGGVQEAIANATKLREEGAPNGTMSAVFYGDDSETVQEAKELANKVYELNGAFAGIDESAGIQSVKEF